MRAGSSTISLERPQLVRFVRATPSRPYFKPSSTTPAETSVSENTDTIPLGNAGRRSSPGPTRNAIRSRSPTAATASPRSAKEAKSCKFATVWSSRPPSAPYTSTASAPRARASSKANSISDASFSGENAFTDMPSGTYPSESKSPMARSGAQSTAAREANPPSTAMTASKAPSFQWAAK